MAFFQGSGIVSATPTTVLFTQLTTMLTDHPAWEFVEEYTESTSTLTVWKCLGTLNSTGEDFFVCFSRTTSTIGTSAIGMRLAEVYNPATNLCNDFVPLLNSTWSPNSLDGTVDSSDVSWLNSNVGALVSITTRTTTFNYMIRVTNDYVAVYASPMTSVAYAGIFESYWAAAYPGFEHELMLAPVGGSATNGGFTSQPAPGYRGVSTSRAFQGGAGNYSVSHLSGAITSVGTLDALSNTLGIGSKVLVLDYAGTTAPQRARGELSTDFLYFLIGAGVVETDTIEVNGITYVYCMSAGNWSTGGTAGLFMSTAA